MRYGVATARRAWLTAEHVANTRPWAELDKLRKRGSQARLDRLDPAQARAAAAASAARTASVRSNQNSTPSRPSIASTALDCWRHRSATRMENPVATTGTCGKKKPTAPREHGGERPAARAG